MNNQRQPWLPRTKLTIILLLLGLFIYLLTRFQVVIGPFVLACILAYIISPIANLLTKRLRLPRGLAVLLIYILMIAGMVTVPVVVIPPLASQIAILSGDLQLFISEAEQFFGHKYIIAGQLIDGAAIFDQVVSLIQELLQPLFGETLGFAFDVIESLVWVIFVFVVSIYLVKDSKTLKEWTESLPPPQFKMDFIHIRDEINNIWQINIEFTNETALQIKLG